MYAAAVKTRKENKSRAVANAVGQRQRKVKPGFELVNNRPGVEHEKAIKATKTRPIISITQKKMTENRIGNVIQLGGTYGGSTLFEKGNPNEIKELEYGEGAKIGFSGISSCLAFIGLKGTELIGVHIPINDSNGDSVTTLTNGRLAEAVKKILSGCTKIMLVGAKMTWEKSATDKWNELSPLGFGLYWYDGEYTAAVDPNGIDDDEKMLIYHNGKQINPIVI